MPDPFSNPFPDFREFREESSPRETGESLHSMFSAFLDEAVSRHNQNIKEKAEAREARGAEGFRDFWDEPDQEEEPEHQDSQDDSDNEDEPDNDDKSDSGDKPKHQDSQEKPRHEDNQKDKTDPPGEKKAENRKAPAPKNGPDNPAPGENKGDAGKPGNDGEPGSPAGGAVHSDDEGLDEDFDEYTGESNEGVESSDGGESGEASDDGSGGGSSEVADSDEAWSGEISPNDEIGAGGGNANREDNAATQTFPEDWEDKYKVRDRTVDDRRYNTPSQLREQERYWDAMNSKTTEDTPYDKPGCQCRTCRYRREQHDYQIFPNLGNVQMLIEAFSKFKSSTYTKLGYHGKVNIREYVKNRVRQRAGELPSLKIFDLPDIENKLNLIVMLDGSGSFARHYPRIRQILTDIMEAKKSLNMDVEIWQGNTQDKWIEFQPERGDLQEVHETVGMMTRIEPETIPDLDTFSGTRIGMWMSFIADRVESKPSTETTLVLSIVDGEEWPNGGYDRDIIADSNYIANQYIQKSLNRMRAAGAIPLTCLWEENPSYIGQIAEFYKPGYYNVQDSNDWYDLTTRYLSREAQKQ